MHSVQAENENEMTSWVKTIDAAATAVIVDERKDLNKLGRKLTSFRYRHNIIIHLIILSN